MSEHAEAQRRRVLWGVPAFAQVINRSVSETRWLIKQKRLRVKKHGARTFSAIEDELLEDVAGEKFPAAAE
jgi:hypothetical protein